MFIDLFIDLCAFTYESVVVSDDVFSLSLSVCVCQYYPPDVCICSFVLEQSLSVRALQEMLAKTGQNNDVSLKKHQTFAR